MASFEDIMARVPILGPLSGAETDEQKALVAQQKRMAEDAKRREAIMGPARLQAMNQSMLAFAPRNKLMAEMFGPDAAFSGKQIADMTANPIVPQADPRLIKLDEDMRKYGLNTYADVQRFNKETDSRLTDSKGFDTVMRYREEKRKAEEAEARRRAGHEAAFAVGPGPAPINPVKAAPVRGRY